MAFFRRHHHRRRHPAAEQSGSAPEVLDRMNPEHTGSESAYLKRLVDSRAKVTVVLKGGERLQGRIRYYDRYCFSVGLLTQGTKIFLRKASVSYICEE